MKIGIDIDGTITDIRSYIFEHGEIYFKGITPNKKGYEVSDIYNVSIDEENNFWDKYFPDYMKNAKLNTSCKETIEKISKDNEIFILTSREYREEYKESLSPNDFFDVTEDYLLKNKIYYEEIVFTNNKKTSVEMLNLDVMIEDKIENIKSISKVCPVIVIDNENNEHINGKNIYHAKDWSEVINLLKAIK